MVKANLAAWTPTENNPPYVSINYCQNRTIEMTIRERSSDANQLGNTARVALTAEEFFELFSELCNSMNRIQMVKSLSESDDDMKRQMAAVLKTS